MEISKFGKIMILAKKKLIIEFEESNPQRAGTANSVLAGVVEGWRSAKSKSNN